MPKTMSIEEARKWMKKNKEKISESVKGVTDPPDELISDGSIIGPANEVDHRRMIKEIEEGGGDD